MEMENQNDKADKQKELLKRMEAEQKGKIPPQLPDSPKDGGYGLWFKHYDKKLDILLEYQLRTSRHLYSIKYMVLGFMLLIVGNILASYLQRV